MTATSRKAASAAHRMHDYRARLRAAGLRPVQLWLPDTQSKAFIRKCRAAARAIAAGDRAGAELQAFIDAAYRWPKG